MYDSNYSRFLIADNVYFSRKQAIQTRLKERYADVCSCLGFQYILYDQIAELAHDSKKDFTLQKQIGQLFYVRNLHYLHGAFNLTLGGLIEPTHNNLRTVLESIFKMYYISLFPEDAEEIQKDMMNNSRKFTTNILIQRLYSEETQKGCQILLKDLHKSAHADYEKTMLNIKFSVEGISEVLKDLLILSFYNIATEIENQSQDPTILDDKIIDNSMSYLENLRHLIIKYNKGFPYLLPDKDSLGDRLAIQL